jgi:hypothetical protein
MFLMEIAWWQMIIFALSGKYNATVDIPVPLQAAKAAEQRKAKAYSDKWEFPSASFSTSATAILCRNVCILPT